jgi:hypothetical protein
MPELAVALSTSNTLLGSYQGILVLINKTSLPNDVLDKSFATAEALLKRFPDGIGYMCVMMPGSSAPDGQGRPKINAWMHQFAPKHMTLGFSLVIEGDTMWGGVMRMVARAIALGNRARYPNEIFDTPTHAATFHAGLTKGGVRAVDLDAAIKRATVTWSAYNGALHQHP